jgi:hypothetical protein
MQNVSNLNLSTCDAQGWLLQVRCLMTMSVKLPMMKADRATDKNMKSVAQIVSGMFLAAMQRVVP